MTYGELKQKIRDLGFEEDSTMSEYSTIVKNGCNQSIQIVYHTVVMRLESYYRAHMSEDDIETYIDSIPEYITDNTPDGFQITIPDNVIELVTLYASYIVWLDDDVNKATYYYNTYVQLRDALIETYSSMPKAKIMDGGVSW